VESLYLLLTAFNIMLYAYATVKGYSAILIELSSLLTKENERGRFSFGQKNILSSVLRKPIMAEWSKRVSIY
jgi:hypothetical protein